MPKAPLVEMRANRATVLFAQRAAGLLAGLAVCLQLAGAVPAAAQGTDWQPFKDKDERAQRNRQTTSAPPALPPVDGSDSNRPYGAPGYGPSAVAPGGSPPFAGSASTGAGRPTIERIELAPIDGATPVSPGAASPGAPSPGAQPGARPLPVGASNGNPPAGVRTGRPPAPSNGFTADLWRGVDLAGLERLVGPLELPPRSSALHALWARLMSAEAAPPSGSQGPGYFQAVRLEALYRSGLTGAMSERLARATQSPDDPLLAAFSVRLALVDGDSARACEGTRRLAATRDKLPKLLKGEVHVLSGYCAAVQGNARGAGLAAELAREDEVEAPFALQVMDALGEAQRQSGQKPPKLAYPKRLTVLEYRLLELLGPPDAQAVLASAEPALLGAIANADNADVRLTLGAAEAAAAMHALAPEGLAEVYRAVTLPANASTDAFFRRAVMFKALLGEADGQRRLQLARQLIEDARRSGLGFVMARALAAPLQTLTSPPADGALAAVAVEVALAGGDYARARQMASSHADAQSWLALVDIADPLTRGVSDGALAAVDGLARQGRFEPAALHRLATVLDALDVNVPIPLWETASRTPPPTTGYLPETGTLPQMQEASRKGEVGRTVLLALRTIGPDGPETSQLVGLGDTLRALRRVGLEADARALALEALFAGWPRTR